MHVILAAIIWATFWSALPVKLVTIAGSVYVLLTILKRYFPAIGGKYAVAINFALTAVGIISVAKPDDLATPTFWASLMLTAASAAGIHGTVRSAANALDAPKVEVDPFGRDYKAPPTGQTPLVQKDRKNLVLLLVLASASIGLAGCVHSPTAATPGPAPALPSGAVDSADANAFKVLRPAHDFAASISADILSGKIQVSSSQRLAMESLNKALNVADHAEQNYHKAGGGSAATMNTAITAVLEAWTKAQAALSQLAGA
jgi:hypothetical protein